MHLIDIYDFEIASCDTASDYWSWLSYFFLPILHGILPEPYFTHFAFLVEAVHILLGESMSETSLVSADTYLRRFYEKFSDLYGQF